MTEETYIYALKCRCGEVVHVCTNTTDTAIRAFDLGQFAVEHQGGSHWLAFVAFDSADPALPPELRAAAREARS